MLWSLRLEDTHGDTGLAALDIGPKPRRRSGIGSDSVTGDDPTGLDILRMRGSPHKPFRAGKDAAGKAAVPAGILHALVSF